MARFRETLLVVALLALAICFSSTSSELHRAKAKSSKSGQNGGTRMSDRDVEYDSTLWGRLARKMNYKAETWVLSMLSAMLVGLSGIFPLLVIPLDQGKALREDGEKGHLLNVVLSFAVGSLLGDVFLHLLPEAWEHIPPEDAHEGHMKIGFWVLFGILAFLIIEKVFAEPEEQALENIPQETKPISNNGVAHSKSKSDIQLNGVIKDTRLRQRRPLHEEGVAGEDECVSNGAASHSDGEEEGEEEEKIHVSGYLNLFANVIDNFTHGLAVAGSYIAGTKVGLLTTFAILVHEIPHEVGDFAILLRSGFDRWKAAKAQVLTASGGLLGALVALCSESAEAAGDSVAWILPFTSGGFLYIALVTVVPDLLKETSPRESAKQVVSLVSGVGMMVLVTYLA